MSKFQTNVTLPAHCNTCDKAVSAVSLVNRDDLVIALNDNANVRVMHVATEDHIWSLSAEDKRKLSDAIDKGWV